MVYRWIRWPNRDWVWNGDGQWNTDHNIEPTKAGYKFAGWYTQANGNGSKIEGVFAGC